VASDGNFLKATVPTSPQSPSKSNEPILSSAEKVAELKGLLEDVAHRDPRAKPFSAWAEKTAGIIAYKIRSSLYLNITNRCSNRALLAKFSGFFVKGHFLLDHEPSLEVMAAISDPSGYDEIVFCGYGNHSFALMSYGKCRP
jgi:TatD DNase family protein